MNTEALDTRTLPATVVDARCHCYKHYHCSTWFYDSEYCTADFAARAEHHYFSTSVDHQCL